MFQDVSLVASYILFFLLGFFCSGNVVAYALAHDLCPPKLVGVAVGFVSTFLYGVGALFDPLIGWLLSKHAVHGAAHDALSYTRDDFQLCAVRPRCLPGSHIDYIATDTRNAVSFS